MAKFEIAVIAPDELAQSTQEFYLFLTLYSWAIVLFAFVLRGLDFSVIDCLWLYLKNSFHYLFIF